MKDAFKILGVLLLAGLFIAGAGVAFRYMSAAATVASAPARVLDRTMATDNIIASYEFFHDAHNNVVARLGQIREHKRLLAEETDRVEQSRLRLELAAMKTACRDLAAKYNANSVKTNKSIFKGREAPEMIELTICEG